MIMSSFNSFSTLKIYFTIGAMTVRYGDLRIVSGTTGIVSCGGPLGHVSLLFVSCSDFGFV